MADALTGGSGLIRIDVSNSGGNAGTNQSTVNWAFYLFENTTANSTFGNGKSASVDWAGVTTLWSGLFNFDWRPAGLQGLLIASGSFVVTHNPDGGGAVTIQGNMGATGTSGAGGPTSVAQSIALTKLTSLPGTPTGLTSTRVSDTQVNLAWAQSSASNGQPTDNRIVTSINGAAFGAELIINPTTSAAVGAAANQKIVYSVRAANEAGGSGYSANSAPLYTTPGAPTGATATKNASLGIDVAFSSTVAYIEHEHELWHGVVSAGVTTWDAAPLVTLASGVLTYAHAAPNAAQVHAYQVRAKAAGLFSTYSTSNSVQLLAPPNKPTVPAMAAITNKAAATVFTWTHNPVDTTPQRAYEFNTSTNGGTTWATSGKVISTVTSFTVAANTHAANVVLTTRVRTWGQATTGGAETTGASPWSDLTAVTFKTLPVATITSPANLSTISEATVRVTVGFTQAEAATFNRASIQLLQGATLLEELDSTVQTGIQLSTVAANGVSYTLRARVRDSNGLWSDWVTSGFSVTYLAPVPAVTVLSYLADKGWIQLDMSFAAPTASQSVATKVTITRQIAGVVETVVKAYPVEPALTFLDTIPAVFGSNLYTITTESALGSKTVTQMTLVTTELRRAFLSKGPGFASVGVFGGNLSITESLSVASATIEASGRVSRIGLYGVETLVELSVTSLVYKGFGSTIKELRAILLMPGKACYRDASGRRLMGAAKGSLSYAKADTGELSFVITETS